MKPVKFKEHNVVYAENQPEYTPLPALKVKSESGEVIACWELSFRERIKLLFTGKLWSCILTFNGALAPSYFTVHKSELINKQNGLL